MSIETFYLILINFPSCVWLHFSLEILVSITWLTIPSICLLRAWSERTLSATLSMEIYIYDISINMLKFYHAINGKLWYVFLWWYLSRQLPFLTLWRLPPWLSSSRLRSITIKVFAFSCTSFVVFLYLYSVALKIYFFDKLAIWFDKLENWEKSYKCVLPVRVFGSLNVGQFTLCLNKLWSQIDPG